MPTFQVHTAARGPHWLAWIVADGADTPFRAVVLVARTQEEAEARGRAWAERASQ